MSQTTTNDPTPIIRCADLYISAYIISRDLLKLTGLEKLDDRRFAFCFADPDRKYGQIAAAFAESNEAAFATVWKALRRSLYNQKAIEAVGR